MKRKTCVFLILCLAALALASAALAAAYPEINAKVNKLAVKAGDRLEVEFTLSNTDSYEYTITGWSDYDADSKTASGTKTKLKSGSGTKSAGKITYRPKASDGACLEIKITAYMEAPGKSFYYTDTFTRIVPITDKSTSQIEITLTPKVSSVKRGQDITFSYQVTGGSGRYSSITYKGYSQVPGDSSTMYILNSGSLKSKSGTITISGVEGDSVWVLLSVTDKDGWEATAESVHVPIVNVKLKKSGWVTQNGKTYYGDEFGYAVTGLKYIDKNLYYFDEDCVLQKDRWILVSDEWRYAGSNGIITDNVKGMESLYIPAEVDSLSPSVFRGADRTFMIICEPGSYAEQFALQYGFQYSNGVKTVRGCDITDVNKKVEWIVANYITSGMSQRQKARVLHNWLIYNAAYDATLTVYTSSGVLVEGFGVCQSYATAYGLLLDRAGIENKLLTDSKVINHAWNLVRIDGQWYHVDCTWDDPVGGSYSSCAVSGGEGGGYFLVGDAYMKQSRAFDEDVHADTNNVRLVTFGNETYYYGADGKRAVGWATVPVLDAVYDWSTGTVSYQDVLHTYYFDQRGVMLKGQWLEENGVWYYLEASGDMATGQVWIGDNLYHFTDDGVWTPYRWIQWENRWYCMDDNDELVRGWLKYGNNWYYLNSSGVMQTGWVQVGGTWYYMNASGVMQTGWLRSGGSWYYLNGDGSMHCGWLKDGGVWYYLDASGVMQTGWIKVSGTWYFMDASGAMQTGWVKSDGKWYYFRDTGAMATGWFRDSAAEKKLPAGQKKELWYYADSSGAMVTGWQEINGRWEMFDSSGLWLYTWDGN